MKDLEPYHRKRDFRKTPEPAGGRVRVATRALRFCVQKHDATRLHYDFRLELDGVLKSWAVPKGPSPDPKDKRLAVEVEDHPLSYRTFEGVIPKGEYGAGTVELWDEGVWEPEGDPRRGLARGRLSFTLRGRRLDGRWSLVRLKDRDGKGKVNWLLMKSGSATAAATRTRRRSAATAVGPIRFVEPELATLAERTPEGDGWIHELKFDGYRILAALEGRRVTLWTRSGRDWTERFTSVASDLAAIGARGTLIDGEIVALDGKGVSSFNALQKAISTESTGALAYQVFDLLFVDGRDVRDRPLLERKQALEQALKGAGRGSAVRYTDHVAGSGEAFKKEACRFELEGIVSKRADSPYRSGRGVDWLKVKCTREQEFVIGGFTDPQGGREGLGALLMGAYRAPGELLYAGRVGTGFDTMILRELRDWLGRLEVKKEPFVDGPSGRERQGVHWVKPVLVAQVKFAGWTGERRLRHASFNGLREDKPAAEVRVESTKAALDAGPGPVAGVAITHPGRVLYPELRLTKFELARFYERIAPWILPHLAGRPLSLVRCPQGREGSCFYQKHWDGARGGVRVVEVQEKGGRVAYPVIDDLQGLVTLVQHGVLEFHPWGSTAKALERPDLCTFDLDPSPEVPWPDVVTAAREVRARLEKLSLRAFVKTTGGKGLHVVVPLEAKADWEAVRAFSKSLAAAMAREGADRFTATMSKQARKGKIFVDWLRNGRGATAVAAYSTRARPYAPVATPVGWDELDALPRADLYTVRNLPSRLEERGDSWKDFLEIRQRLPRTT